jgi:hypothetical protein
MSMLKIIQSGSQDLGDKTVELIKVGSRGRLIGHDRSIFEKRAGSRILFEIDNIEIPKGEQLIHLLAMGSTEKFGANRNGDGFRECVLDRTHPTFVKYGHFFRDHLNKDPAKSYGRVLLSAYHEPMSRVELICGLNATKEAALRNGGLIADRELEKLAKHEEIPVSMACRVPFDVCSYCDNRAPTRREYCEDIAQGGRCKAGGLKYNLGRTVTVDGDAHHLHADNTEPTFFDISHVFRPADRTAYVLGELQKAASDGRTVSGAELAETLGLTMPYALLVSGNPTGSVARQLKLACLLADEERATRCNNHRIAFAASVQPPIALPEGRITKFAQVMRALVDTRSLLPVRDFIRLTTNLSEKQATIAADLVSACLPGAFSRLVRDPNLEQSVASNPYMPETAATESLRNWAEKHAAGISLAEPHVQRRVHLAALRGEQVGRCDVDQAEKLAAAGGPAAELAEQYCLYQLAFLESIPETANDFPLTATLVSMHNHAR